ncbi:BON domain-containing protein [Roseomonas genomospecies 6]|uniref:BON domain-containing protein n=1 Tax=Roseomonas genomospecies 6 TaxID=214106 RepID=A0A9W7U0C2_9PROT|nr:BON domain-containing protein [Roseomonas genomospecies 6]KAA0684117.1 BON domain-containing protein [Roseomonas genomospecies 6]
MAQHENRWKDETRNVDGDERREARDRGDFGRGAYGAGGYPGSDYESGGYGDRDPSRRWGSDWGHAERGRHGNDHLQGDRMRAEHHRDEPIGLASERNFWEQAGDEIASWFGNDDAERRREDDEMRARHRGRGPRGYTRSDDRIRDDLNDRLTEDPYVDATDITVSVAGGEVTLDGTVDHRKAKRRAEDLAESVSGVRHVQNNLRVRQQSGSMAY